MAASLLLATADDMQRYILFAVFLLIFCATAIITLLGIIGKVKIRDGYLKALFSALILEVIGVIIAVAKSTLSPAPPPPLPDEYQVWTVMGKMDMSHSHLSPSGVPYVGIEVLPQPALDSNGIFDFYVAARRTNGTYELPTVRFVDPEAKQFREIHLDPKWGQYDEVKIDRNVKDHIANISPFLLLPLPNAPANPAIEATDASRFRNSTRPNIVTVSNAAQSPAPGPQPSP
jgi:hypothetical protein